MASEGGGKGLRKKVGPLEVWQYAAIGTGLGGILYLYKSKKGGGGEEEKSQKEKELLEEELAATRFGGNPLGGAGSGGGSSGGTPTAIPTAAEIASNIHPEAGVAGAPGAPGAPGEGLSEAQENALNSLVEGREAGNNPPTGSQQTAPQAKSRPEQLGLQGVNSKGEKYKTGINSKGQYVHEYVDGRKVVLTGAAAAAAKKAHEELYGPSKTHGSTGQTAKADHGKTSSITEKAKATAAKKAEAAKKAAEAKKKAAEKAAAEKKKQEEEAKKKAAEAAKKKAKKR